VRSTWEFPRKQNCSLISHDLQYLLGALENVLRRPSSRDPTYEDDLKKDHGDGVSRACKGVAFPGNVTSK
jgi:hypothetical protein